MPVGWRPPWVKISQRAGSPAFDTCLASMATTMHWSPNFSAASLTNARLFTAAVLIDTLSAPDESSARMSSMVRTPPPTVSGMKQASAVRRTTCLLYTSDAADEEDSVDLGGRRIIKKK